MNTIYPVRKIDEIFKSSGKNQLSGKTNHFSFAINNSCRENCSQLDRDALAKIVFRTDKFFQHLIRCHFQLITDIQPIDENFSSSCKNSKNEISLLIRSFLHDSIAKLCLRKELKTQMWIVYLKNP